MKWLFKLLFGKKFSKSDNNGNAVIGVDCDYDCYNQSKSQGNVKSSYSNDCYNEPGDDYDDWSETDIKNKSNVKAKSVDSSKNNAVNNNQNLATTPRKIKRKHHKRYSTLATVKKEFMYINYLPDSKPYNDKKTSSVGNIFTRNNNRRTSYDRRRDYDDFDDVGEVRDFMNDLFD